MRKKNMRAIVVGAVLIVAAAGFFLWMMTLAPQSDDPVKLMRIVGETSGVVAGIAAVLIVVGFVGTKKPAGGAQ